MIQYSTHINPVAIGDSTAITVTTTFNNGYHTALNATIPTTRYQAMQETAKLIAQDAAAKIRAVDPNHENAKASNVETGVFLTLLRLPTYGIKAESFLKGQPGFDVLETASLVHKELPHVAFADAVGSQLLTYYIKTHQNIGKPVAGQGTPVAGATR